MDQHPVPRQITTFEFKLIGFMTLKQFLYLLVFFPSGFIVYKIFPIPFVNALLGIIVGAFGLALAFLPVNERPLDVWIRNLIKRLVSPTQYTYEKTHVEPQANPSDPRTIDLHVDSQKKLDAYLQSKATPISIPEAQQATTDTQIFTETPAEEPKKEKQPDQQKQSLLVGESSVTESPFFIGVVKNKKEIPLPGMLVYVKNIEGTLVRLLKTNPHGVFATFHQLDPAEYIFEIADPAGRYFFDTMNIRIEKENPDPFEIYSKELL